MPDLTMCRPSTPCPRQDRCYRFTTTPQEQWQSTASFEPGEDGECAGFVENGADRPEGGK